MHDMKKPSDCATICSAQYEDGRHHPERSHEEASSHRRFARTLLPEKSARPDACPLREAAGKYKTERTNAVINIFARTTCCSHPAYRSVPRAGGSIVSQLEPAAWKETPAEQSAWNAMFEDLCMDDVF